MAASSPCRTARVAGPSSGSASRRPRRALPEKGKGTDMPEKKPARGRVLVVEDEAYVRTSLGELLGQRGFDVDLSGSVADAFTSLSRWPVDVVLTDLRMPGGDGLDLVKKMQAAYPHVGVVVLTGQGTIASAVECIKAGASDYILKPADPDALEIALERALRTRALQREVDYLRGREGRFRLAHRGTLFMDEIADMPLAAQAKILRVLQDGEFDRVGDERPTRVDVRVVAATNSDIDALVADRSFRQDLFYRLNVVRSEEHTSELQSRLHLVCRLLLEKKKKKTMIKTR